MVNALLTRIFRVQSPARAVKLSSPEAWLLQQAVDARHVHLAAHGAFSPNTPQFSQLCLTPSGAIIDAAEDVLSSCSEGLLEIREVWNLPLEAADLVILAACQTQLGDLSVWDELGGLTRAFFFASTPTVVASLWTVDDQATALLMERFYTHLQAGMGKAEALRQAQLDIREDYPNPYYWSAFVLSGDAGKVDTLVPPPAETPSPTPIPDTTSGGGGLCAGAALPLMLFALVWIWRWR